LPGGNSMKIMFCTTENDAPHIRRALDAGADEYIMKPFDGEIVRSKLTILGLLDNVSG
jgi:two-component system chemotaxis response regulator CheY